MKNNKLLLIVSGVFLTFALISCGKDSDKNTKPQPQPSGAILPSVISYTQSASSMPDARITTFTSKFEYDIQDRITKIHSEIFDNGLSRGFVSTLTFTYSVNNIKVAVTRTDIPWEPVSSYDYYQRGSDIVVNGNQYAPVKLDERGRALNYRSFDNTTDYELTYDGDGNATSIKVYDIRQRTDATYILTPGQSNGIFRNVKTPSWFIISQMGVGGCFSETSFGYGELAYQQLTNNCVKSMEVDGETVYEYNYMYNGDNYPTLIMRNPNIVGGEYLRYQIEYTVAD